MQIGAIAILDSSALVALSSDADTDHQRALVISKILENKGTTMIVPGDIFAESMNVISKKISRQIALDTAKKLLYSGQFIIIETTSKIRSAALRIFQSQARSVSFTDCLVMAFADEYQTKHIFAFNEHFGKNGYIRFGIDGKS